MGFLKSNNLSLYIAVAILILLIMVAALAPLLTPYDPVDVSLADSLRPPFWEKGGTTAYPLGTDKLGRSILGQLIYGTRVTLLVAAASLICGGGVGTFIAIVSGFLGGKVDMIMMRIVDSTLAFPSIFFALLLGIILGQSFTTLIIAISAIIWARFARMLRGEVLSLKEQDYVNLARTAGSSSVRIMAVHIFPNVMNTLMVLMSLEVGHIILLESVLSFLGAGIPPPTPSWGRIISEGREYITTAWWIATFPGIAIGVMVLAFNLLGDWLRDRLDPRLRQI